jgi:predicted small secreted protein
MMYALPRLPATQTQVDDSSHDISGTPRALVWAQSFLNTPWEYEMKTVMTILLVAFATSLTACNTVEGAGKDVKATGAAVEKAADQAKPK